jgi:hypothetical protein
MGQEMQDAQCKFFTGRLSRLVNCLNGFDENIVIQISDGEQIGITISTIQKKLELDNQYTVERFKEEINTELTERGFSKEIIMEWLEHIE